LNTLDLRNDNLDSLATMLPVLQSAHALYMFKKVTFINKMFTENA